MPETRAVRRLHHSAEAISLELPQQSYHQGDQSIIPSCGDGVFSDERPSVKMKLDNIWNNKLQAQGECSRTRDGESKEDERICLEELLEKVISGQKRTTTYLDSEQELVQFWSSNVK